MIIDATAVGLVPDSPILLNKLAVNITLQLTPIKGEPFQIKANEDFDSIPPFLPEPEKPATLTDLVAFVIRRQHPVIDYLADKKGVKVVEYHERPSFRQAMACIDYRADSPSIKTPF